MTTLSAGDSAIAMLNDERFLRRAIELASAARAAGEDPFGAVLVHDGRIVFEAKDATIADADPTSHAELRAISAYCRQLGTTSLDGHALYANAEPCAMCAGAIHWAKLAKLVFSVPQPALQSLTGGKVKLEAAAIVNSGSHTVTIAGGLLLDEGLKVFEGYRWRAKALRIQERRR